MNISDLNHLEVVEASSVVGGTSYGYTTYDNEYINVDVNFDFDNKFKSLVYLQGNTASSKSLADAFGPYSKADTFNQTKTIAGYGSSSVGISGSASSFYPSYNPYH